MKRYPVHRAIVCSRSEFFDGAVRNPFRESETGVIDLTEDDPEAVEHMVDCKHNGDSLGDLRPPLSSASPRLLPSRLPHQVSLAPLIETILTTSIVAQLTAPADATEVQEDQPRADRRPSSRNYGGRYFCSWSSDAASRPGDPHGTAWLVD